MILLLLAAGTALAGEFRTLSLSDGRALTVEVFGSEATGLVVGVPQGRMHLPFEEVLSITPVDASAYAALRPLRIVVLPFTAAGGAPADAASRAQGLVASELDAIPATEMYALAQLGGAAVTAEALSLCGADLNCVRARVASYNVDVVIGGTLTGADQLSLVIAYPPWRDAGGTASAVLSGYASAQHMAAQRAVHALLRLEVPPQLEPVAEVTPPVVVVPETPAVVVVTPPPEILPVPTATRRTPTVAPWVAAIPLPGITAWAGGEVGQGLAAAAIVVPATAGIGWFAGSSGSRPEDVIGITAASWWVLCAFTNVAWMPAITPTEGGAKVSVGSVF